jgi:hypothetical protein
MSNKVYEFQAVMKKPENVNGAYVEFPYDVEKEFGVRGQVKVKAYFDGYEYRGSLVKMGSNCHILGITQAIRKSIGKEPGDIITVKLSKDDEERVIDVPQELKELLDTNPKAKEFFDSLSYTNRKEYVTWITTAKREETRKNRLVVALEKLLNGIRSPK